MNITIHRPAEREALQVQANREELIERIGQVMSVDGSQEPLPGLHLARSSFPLKPLHSVLKPSLCLIAQGSKEVLFGESRYQYDSSRYRLATVELPRVSQVLEASKERPYLSLRLELSAPLVSSVLVEVGYTTPRDAAPLRAIDVHPLDARLLDAMVRLVRLLDEPDEAPVLQPLIMREIIYRLLKGEQGSRLRHVAIQEGYNYHITRAIERLHQDFDQPLRIENLARELGMSVSALHHHFKAVTALSPLQFQKQLRLQEARRLMVSQNLDAANAAFQVGYRDASHFNREYKSLFGLPPLRDVQRLREEALVSSRQ